MVDSGETYIILDNFCVMISCCEGATDSSLCYYHLLPDIPFDTVDCEVRISVKTDVSLITSSNPKNKSKWLSFKTHSFNGWYSKVSSDKKQVDNIPLCK